MRPDLSQVTWRKSTRSANGGQCVEVATVAGRVAVRDSKDPAGPALVFPGTAWDRFVDGIECDLFLRC